MSTPASNETFFSFNALQSARSSGYRNTYWALAELIDNAFDAKAKTVKVILLEDFDSGRRKQVTEVLVCDDGEGMNESTVQSCLQFGRTNNGDLEEVVRLKKKGKFGFGLPNASLSQCPNIHVFSRTKAGDWNTTYLNLKELKEQNSIQIPPVAKVASATYFQQVGAEFFDTHGTIISWKDCDRLSNVRAETLIRKATEVIGRIYRHLLVDGDDKKKIIFEAYLFNSERRSYTRTVREETKPNDPLFLMEDTLIAGRLYEHSQNAGAVANPELDIAAHYKKFSISKDRCKATNQKLEDHCFTFNFNYKGRVHEFRITTSCAHINIQKPGVREGGNAPIGQFYGDRKFISFVRAGREIDMGNYNLYRETDETNRWWSVEVQFGPESDDLLGVHNNKQGIEYVALFPDGSEDAYHEHTATLPQARDRLWALLTEKLKAVIKAAHTKVKKEARDWQARHDTDKDKPDSPGLPGQNQLTTEAANKTDGTRESSFSPEQRRDLLARLKARYPTISESEINSSIDRFDEFRSKGCLLYCGSDDDKQLWSFTWIHGFLVVLVNTDHEFYNRLIAPLRTAKAERALAAIELFIIALASEEAGESSKEAEPFLGHYRAAVGLHLSRYLRDSQINLVEKDFRAASTAGAADDDDDDDDHKD